MNTILDQVKGLPKNPKSTMPLLFINKRKGSEVEHAKGCPPIFLDWSIIILKSPIHNHAPLWFSHIVERESQKLLLFFLYDGPYIQDKIQGLLGGLE